MKKMFVVMTLALSSSMSFASNLWCAENDAHKGVKTVCAILDKEEKIAGFLLYNANGTKSYLVVTKAKYTASGDQTSGLKSHDYTVKASDSDLNPSSDETAKFSLKTSWVYSDGLTVLSGHTPGGRQIYAIMESGDSVRD